MPQQEAAQALCREDLVRDYGWAFDSNSRWHPHQSQRLDLAGDLSSPAARRVSSLCDGARSNEQQEEEGEDRAHVATTHTAKRSARSREDPRFPITSRRPVDTATWPHRAESLLLLRVSPTGNGSRGHAAHQSRYGDDIERLLAAHAQITRIARYGPAQPAGVRMIQRNAG